jgi:hypothetical protein
MWHLLCWVPYKELASITGQGRKQIQFAKRVHCNSAKGIRALWYNNHACVFTSLEFTVIFMCNLKAF